MMTPVLLNNRYRVLTLLGDGGFGQTYLVEDTQMPSNRRCVLKQLKPVNDNPQIRQVVQDRFQREAAIQEKLGEAHDQIPRLYAYFSEAEQFYLVEEWIEGDTLSQKVQREGAQPEAVVQSILASLLPAIAYVHSQGIVHRDLKPDNIIVRKSDGKPVLIDFGSVKETMSTVLNSQGQSSNSIVVGTPGYSPSEQLAGRPLFASDFYSLGLTAIYLLTGKIPQELDSDPMTGTVLWRRFAPSVSPEFADFLDRAIHMHAQSRFLNAQDMLSALNALIIRGRLTLPPEPPSMPAPMMADPMPTPMAPPMAPQPMAPQPIAPQPMAAIVQPMPPQPMVQPISQPIAQPNVSPIAQPLPLNLHAQGTHMVTPSNQPSGPVIQPSSEWKKAVIVGSMVGVSVLVSALVLRSQMPGASTAATQDSTKIERRSDPAAQPTPSPSASPAAAIAPATNNPAPAVNNPAPAEAPNSNATVVGQSGSKNIRSGPGMNNGIVNSVYPGDRVQMVDRKEDSAGSPWYRVVIAGGSEGWIAGQLIQVDGDAKAPKPANPDKPTSSEPPTSQTPAEPVDGTNATIVGEGGSKNIRSGPGMNHATRHIAYPGDRIVIQDTEQDSSGYTWYKVSFPKSGAEGWIAAQLVKPDQ